MGDVVIAAVGHRSGQVGDLERRGADLTLPDGQGDDGLETPAALAVDLVVEGRGRDVAAQLGREVAAELAAEAETEHILAPDVEGFRNGPVLLVVQDVAEDVAEIAVAGGGQRLDS